MGRPETKELNSSMQIAARRRDIETVLTLMREEAKSADGATYAIAINACAEVGDVDGAIEWLHSAAEKGGRFAPGVAACTAACKALCGAGRVGTARLLLECMGSKKKEKHKRFWVAARGDGTPKLAAMPNVRTANTFLRGCLRSGGHEAASWCLAKLKDWGVEADASSRSYAVTTLCAALRPREAASIAGSDPAPDACAVVARAYAVLGDNAACSKWARRGLDALSKEPRDDGATGGRRPWGQQTAERAASNASYRAHRAAEAKAELESLASLAGHPDALGAILRSLVVPVGPRGPGADLVSFGLDRVSRSRDAEMSLDHRRRLGGTAGDVLALELGAGDGEWATRRAATTPWRWMACEARYDRAAKALATAALRDVKSLGIVHGYAGACLKTFPEATLDKCFANFPEPPVQTGTADDPAAYEARHMLDAELFREVARVLKTDGTFVIVTDNSWYARLLLRIAAGCFVTPPLPAATDYKVIHGAGVRLHVGRLGPAVGHFDDAASTYFDRLWRTGLSKHAAKADRFVLYLQKKKKSDVQSPPPATDEPAPPRERKTNKRHKKRRDSRDDDEGAPRTMKRRRRRHLKKGDDTRAANAPEMTPLV